MIRPVLAHLLDRALPHSRPKLIPSLYGCGYHNDRGATVSENRLLESERVVDRRLLEEIEAILLVPEARDYAFEQARRIVREQIAGSEGDVGSLRARLREIERELDQLVRAVEQGGPLKSLVERISRREEERAALERRCEELGQLSSVTELELRRVDRLITEHVGALGEMLRGDARVAKTALRQILSGQVIFSPSATEAGEPTYLLDATVDLGTCVPRADRMTVNVPDGIGDELRTRIQVVAADVLATSSPATDRKTGQTWQLVHHASMNASKPLLLVAGTTTAEAREILRNHGVNVVDGIGNAHIALPGLFFHVEAPRPNDRDRTTPARTRLAGKTGAVAQAILLHPDHALRVADVAKDAHVSPSLAHRVLSRLERERLLEAEGRGPKRVRRVINPSGLLDLYAEENADRPNRILGHLLTQTPEQLSARLATNLAKADIDYAITGAAAASVVAPFITAIPIVELWVRDDAAPKDVHAASGAHPVTEGANVVFLQEKSDTPLLFRENVNDRWFANRFQIYVDLRRDPRRGKEQADHLRRGVIEF